MRSWSVQVSVDLFDVFSASSIPQKRLNNTTPIAVHEANPHLVMAEPLFSMRARIILRAVQLATDADVPKLSQLIAQQTQILKLELILRILLTYLPESTDPALYVEFLQDLSAGRSFEDAGAVLQSAISPQQDLSEDDAIHRVQRLHLLPLNQPNSFLDESIDTFTIFLMHRAHRMDAETGSLLLVAQMLSPFVDNSESLRTWMVSTVFPLLRLDYEYYPHRAPAYSLSDFEKLDGTLAVSSLLSEAAQSRTGDEQPEIGRDLRGLVGPWMFGESERKRRKLNNRQRRRSSITATLYGPSGDPTESGAIDHVPSGWAYVNEWLLDLAVRHFPRAVEAIEQWNGPSDVDYGAWGEGCHQNEEEAFQSPMRRYTQAGLATIYATSSSTAEALEESRKVLVRVAQLSDLPNPSPLEIRDPTINANISHDYDKTLSQGHLLYNSLLGAQNPLTIPSQFSLYLAYLLLTSASILEKFGHSKTCKSVAELYISGSESDQTTELRKVLYKLQANKRDEKAWNATRLQMLWLRDWNWQPEFQDSDHPRGVFCKIKKVDLETEMLKAFLSASCESTNVVTILLFAEALASIARCSLILFDRLQACS